MANFEINQSQSAVNQIMRKLETGDPVHADVYNALFGLLINNDAFLERMASKLVEKIMVAHSLESVNPNMVLGADQAPQITKLIDAVDRRCTALYSEIGAIVANPKTKLLIKYGNTSISSNPDGTFRLTHGLGVPCVVIARFGGANARYITFGGDIDPNNAYGIVRETTGEGYAFSGYIFWVAIGFVAK